MQLHALTSRELVFPNLSGSDAVSLLSDFAKRVADQGIVDDAENLYERLREREELGSTGIGGGVAIPHCKVKRLDRVVVAVATSRKEIDFGAVDGQPVRLFFMVLSPEKAAAAHLQSLAAISKWVKADQHVERILGESDADVIYELLGEEGPAE